MQVLEDFLRLHEEAADLTHVNILAELLMEGHKWGEAQAAILQAHQRAGEQPLPIDLQASAPAGSHSTSQGWGFAGRGLVSGVCSTGMQLLATLCRWVHSSGWCVGASAYTTMQAGCSPLEHRAQGATGTLFGVVTVAAGVCEAVRL